MMAVECATRAIGRHIVRVLDRESAFFQPIGAGAVVDTVRPGVRQLPLHIALKTAIYGDLKRIVHGVGAILGAVEITNRRILTRVWGNTERTERSEHLVAVRPNYGNRRITIGLIEQMHALR